MLGKFGFKILHNSRRGFSEKIEGIVQGRLTRSDLPLLTKLKEEIAVRKGQRSQANKKTNYYITQIINSSHNEENVRPFYDSFYLSNSFYNKRNYSYNFMGFHDK